jgi:hypothetical protein
VGANSVKISICVSCGSIKNQYGDECPACHFRPESKRDLAKSLLLSQEAVFKDIDLPKTLAELKTISLNIANGKPYPFNQVELDKFEKIIDEVGVFAKRITWTRLILFYVLPVVVLWLAIGYFVYELLQ